MGDFVEYGQVVLVFCPEFCYNQIIRRPFSGTSQRTLPSDAGKKLLCIQHSGFIKGIEPEMVPLEPPNLYRTLVFCPEFCYNQIIRRPFSGTSQREGVRKIETG
mgnify:CR=1 FL=1